MKRAYIDSSVIINRMEGNETYRSTIDQAFISLHKDDWKPCISDAVVLEVLIKPQWEDNVDLIQKYKRSFKSLYHLSTYTRLFQDALKISSIESIKAMDAIHAAMAVHYQCELFVTADSDLRKLKCLPVSFLDFGRIISQQHK